MRKKTDAMISGIIFDMDGVLCDSEPFICEAARKMFAERHKLEVAQAEFVPFVGAGEDRYLSGPAEKHGCRLDLAADKARTYAIYLDIIKGRLRPLAGAREFILACRRRGVKMAVASSADRIKIDGNLSEIGIPAGLFDACVCGEEVARKKPAPDIFLLAASRLALPPGQCLVVEDAVNGIKAACAAGMRALGITTSFTEESLRSAGAEWIAPDLARLPPLPLSA